MTRCRSLRRHPSLRGPAAVCGVLWVLGLVLGCSEPQPDRNVGSNTNWLRPCQTSQVCGGDLVCHCGACMIGCSTDADCESLGDVRCVLESDTAAAAQCGTSASWSTNGICLPRCEPGTCDQAQACAVSTCVPLALPESDFCLGAAAPGPEQRMREDELTALVEQLRLSGGVVCPGGGPSQPVAALRLDASLFCAARVFAVDLEQSRIYSLTDSLGRTGDERINLAGYSGRLAAWGFVIGTQSAANALDQILSDADFCSGVVDPLFTDIGVGFSGDTYVVTLGVQ